MIYDGLEKILEHIKKYDTHSMRNMEKKRQK